MRHKRIHWNEKNKNLLEWSLISILECIEEASALLGRNDEPTINNVVVFVFIISNVYRFIDSDSDLSDDVAKMCEDLKKDILDRRTRIYNNQLMEKNDSG